MNLEQFKATLNDAQPPNGLAPLLMAMWWDAKGDWHAAHDIAQDEHNEMGSLIHAYLHRKEGDLGNARYWYRHANRAEFTGSLGEEWEAIASELVGS